MTRVIQNKVKSLCTERKLDREQFIGLCLQSRAEINGKRLTYDTAGRAYDGETTLSLTTAALIAAALNVELSEIFTIK